MAGGHSESAHNVLVDDYPVGPRTTGKVADLHTWGNVTGIGTMVGYASDETDDDMTFTRSMTRMVICGGWAQSRDRVRRRG